MANAPTQATPCDLEIPNEPYYAVVTQYVGNYMWEIADRLPALGSELWKMFEGRAAEYFQAVEMRGSAIAIGKELKRHFLTGKRGRERYAAPCYIQRLETIEDASGDTSGIFIEWEQVRKADICVHTLLKIQALTNPMQKLRGGKIECQKHAQIGDEKGTWKFPTGKDMADYSSTRRSTHS